MTASPDRPRAAALTLRRVDSVRQVRAARPADAYLRCEAAAAGGDPHGYLCDTLPGTVALVRRRWADDGLNVVVLGDPDDAALLAEAVLVAEPGVVSAFLPRGGRTPLLADAPLHRQESSSWDWMWTPAAPAEQLPGEDAVEPVDDPEPVRALLAAAYPRPGRSPGHPNLAGWLGVRDGDRLGGCATWEWHGPQHAHLSTIVVAPHLRGRGIGAALTAALTRRLLDGTLPEPGPDRLPARTVALGVYPDNAVAIRLYQQLGFTTGCRFDVWTLAGR